MGELNYECRNNKFFEKNAANLPLEEPLTITKNGKPVYVIESVQDRDKREEAIALLNLVSFAKSDMQAGRVMSSSSFKERLVQRKSPFMMKNNSV
ncbi:type II toxin-antitoxin system prevent-host-death family antitoxin [Pseudoalteromonas sp. KJ10-2]|uniref:type II toxin-antitoxin system prevent-host-death family antitoxin n=1 Tax=unclassified Psychromonas TaxID=2614957 RepID=UPI0039B5BF98